MGLLDAEQRGAQKLQHLYTTTEKLSGTKEDDVSEVWAEETQEISVTESLQRTEIRVTEQRVVTETLESIALVSESVDRTSVKDLPGQKRAERTVVADRKQRPLKDRTSGTDSDEPKPSQDLISTDVRKQTERLALEGPPPTSADHEVEILSDIPKEKYRRADSERAAEIQITPREDEKKPEKKVKSGDMLEILKQKELEVGSEVEPKESVTDIQPRKTKVKTAKAEPEREEPRDVPTQRVDDKKKRDALLTEDQTKKPSVSLKPEKKKIPAEAATRGTEKKV